MLGMFLRYIKSLDADWPRFAYRGYYYKSEKHEENVESNNMKCCFGQGIQTEN